MYVIVTFDALKLAEENPETLVSTAIALVSHQSSPELVSPRSFRVPPASANRDHFASIKAPQRSVDSQLSDISTSLQMAMYPTNGAVVFGEAHSRLDAKPFTFTANPQTNIQVKKEPTPDDEGPMAIKRKQESQDPITIQSKRHKVQLPMPEPEPIPEARCCTPYPEAESEPYSPTDLDQSGTHHIDEVLQGMIRASVRDMVSRVKRHVKDECETALDAAWRDVIDY